MSTWNPDWLDTQSVPDEGALNLRGVHVEWDASTLSISVSDAVPQDAVVRHTRLRESALVLGGSDDSKGHFPDVQLSASPPNSPSRPLVLPLRIQLSRATLDKRWWQLWDAEQQQALVAAIRRDNVSLILAAPVADARREAVSRLANMAIQNALLVNWLPLTHLLVVARRWGVPIVSQGVESDVGPLVVSTEKLASAEKVATTSVEGPPKVEETRAEDAEPPVEPHPADDFPLRELPDIDVLTSPRESLTLGRRLLRKGDTETAERIVAALDGRVSGEMEVERLLLAGESALQEGRWADAGLRLRAAARLDPDNQEVRELLVR